MLFNLYINQKMGMDNDLSLNATIVFEAMKQLMALSYIDKKTVDDEIYTVLHQNMLIKQFPIAKIKSSTLTKAMKELKNADLIKTDGVNQRPAYAFTDKAKAYIPNIKNQINIKNRKEPLFQLKKPTKVAELNPDYYSLLKEHCLKLCKDNSISGEEFENFIDHYISNGKKLENWISQFRIWIRNSKKYNVNKTDDDSRGMYR